MVCMDAKLIQPNSKNQQREEQVKSTEEFHEDKSRYTSLGTCDRFAKEPLRRCYTGRKGKLPGEWAEWGTAHQLLSNVGEATGVVHPIAERSTVRRALLTGFPPMVNSVVLLIFNLIVPFRLLLTTISENMQRGYLEKSRSQFIPVNLRLQKWGEDGRSDLLLVSDIKKMTGFFFL